jgi:choline dehydrogenase-like flavoprotein
MRRRAIVVGSGAGGATVAKELQGEFDVTVVEAGKDFRRATLDRRAIERLRRSRLLLDPRLVRVVYPPIRFRRTPDMLLVNGIGTGGTTTMATGNGIRMDEDLRVLGLDLDREFDQIARSRSRPRTSAGGTRPRDVCSARSTNSVSGRSSCRRWATPNAAGIADAACSAAPTAASGTAARPSTRPFGAAPG